MYDYGGEPCRCLRLHIFAFAVWDANACNKNDEYIGEFADERSDSRSLVGAKNLATAADVPAPVAGDKAVLPGYVHSITSTENYVIIPVTSLLINPCKFKEPPPSSSRSSIARGKLWGMDYAEVQPLRQVVYSAQCVAKK